MFQSTKCHFNSTIEAAALIQLLAKCVTANYRYVSTLHSFMLQLYLSVRFSIECCAIAVLMA